MANRLLFLCALLFVSCEKEVDLFQVEKDRIEREWEVQSLIETFVSGDVTSSASNNFLVEFKDDETVVFRYPDQGGREQVNTWYYQLRPERIIIVNSGARIGQFLVPNDYFLVLEKTDTRQVWQSEDGDGFASTVKTWTLTASN